jgi:hypothetical protein
MPPRRSQLMPMALGAVLALLLMRRSSRTTGEQPRSFPVPPPATPVVVNEPSPRFVRFIHRYAVAEIAALIGIPLAVIGLTFTALATRDAALQAESSNRQLEASIEQLRLSEQAAQPELSLNGHLARGGGANSPGRFDRLSISVTGTAKHISARIETVFGLQADNVEPEFDVTFFEWWRWAGAGTAEAASWTANPELLRELDAHRLRTTAIMFSLVEVSYADVFGRFHTKYFWVNEVLGRRSPYAVGPASSVAEVKNVSAAVRCQQELAVQRNKEQGSSSLVDGVVRKPTRVYAKLVQGKPITFADLRASVSSRASEECYRATAP